MSATMAKDKRPNDPPTHQDDPILTPEEVGRRLGKTGVTIRKWIQDGLLESLPTPSGLRGVRTSEVNKFLGGSAITKRV